MTSTEARKFEARRSSDLVETTSPVRWEQFAEGLCVQTLHVGPYDAEDPTPEQPHHEGSRGAGSR